MVVGQQLVTDKDTLYCISSGANVPDLIEKDIMNAETIGKTSKYDIIHSRLETKVNFFKPIRRKNFKTMADMNKTTRIKAGKNKTIEYMYKQQGNIAFQLLVKSQTEGGQLDLNDLMRYPLTPVPYSIAIADGYFAKTDKAKGLHYLTKDIPSVTYHHPRTHLLFKMECAISFNENDPS